MLVLAKFSHDLPSSFSLESDDTPAAQYPSPYKTYLFNYDGNTLGRIGTGWLVKQACYC